MPTQFDLKDIPPQPGRVAIVTGANVGLGFETAVGLALKEITVILACRNLVKANAAKERILQRVPGGDIEVLELDLKSLDSVKAFAKKFLAENERLDLLINNAGIMMTPFENTAEGFESQFGVNYLGHFVLTGLLLPLLEKTEGSRVVALSSNAHKKGKIDFENLNAERSYSKMGAYSRSKLACLMFAYELNRRLETAGCKTISVAAHPGFSITDLGRHLPKLAIKIVPFVLGFMTHPVESGARPTLQAALDPHAKGGDYFGPTGFMEMKGDTGKVKSTAASYDKDVAKRLWEESERLTGMSYL